MNEYVEYLSDNKSFKYDNLEVKCPNDLIKVNSNNYKIFLFKNYHLGNSQNDIWEIKLTSSNITCGFLLPITRLDDSELILSDETVSEKTIQSINKYKYACYELLLKNYISNKYKIDDKEISISDLYPDFYILILCNKFIGNFNIYNYLPYLYKLRFIYVDFSKINVPLPNFHQNKRDLTEIYKKNKAIKLFPTFSDISKYEYIKNLFEEDLISVDNNLARFMMLYQIIEIYIENRLEYCAQKYLHDYERKICNFNDFKENINKMQKERTRIDSLLKLKAFDNNFENEYKNLNFMQYEASDSLGVLLYNLRNKIVHSFHSIEKTSLLNNLIDEMELILIELLLQKPINIQECIREKAYFISLENPANSEIDNWFLAEQECKEFK